MAENPTKGLIMKVMVRNSGHVKADTLIHNHVLTDNSGASDNHSDNDYRVFSSLPVENFSELTSHLPAVIREIIDTDKSIQSEKSDNISYVN